MACFIKKSENSYTHNSFGGDIYVKIFSKVLSH